MTDMNRYDSRQSERKDRMDEGGRWAQPRRGGLHMGTDVPRQRESCSSNQTSRDKSPSVILFHWMVTNPNHHTQGSKSKW